MKKTILLIFILVINQSIYGQDLDKEFNYITTIIDVSSIKETQGSGFFYIDYDLNDVVKGKDGSKSVAVNGIYLITNRHVILTKDELKKEHFPDSIKFNFRSYKNGKAFWNPISVYKEEIKSKLLLHRNKVVDIAVLDIVDFVFDDNHRIVQDDFHGISDRNLIRNTPYKINVSDDVVTIGYPEGFYDKINLFPIVKQGIIASSWGLKFNGLPYFLIDSKLFPGSSGSLVITKPTHTYTENGRMIHSKNKQYAFLGVYSGEPIEYTKEVMDMEDMLIVKKNNFDVGIVWYSYLVEEIIKYGVNYKE